MQGLGSADAALRGLEGLSRSAMSAGQTLAGTPPPAARGMAARRTSPRASERACWRGPGPQAPAPSEDALRA